ncbi:MAG: GNAT family N-acetyltransferase [Oscillospiraceae bacterium]|nr:GNAT family N-acetyltransferase [Oscillospiraceae bacterium]
MQITFLPVTQPEQIDTLAALAKEIWQEHFTPILKPGQVDYMVEKFQSVPAMTEQIQHGGYRYFLLQKGTVPIGYTGVKSENGKLFLSKLYLQKQHRGKGYASKAFAFLESLCQKEGLSAIWLTVNRYNTDTIAIYKKKGFSVIRTQVTDIGGGYVMDDYVMEKPVGGTSHAV